jgi:hypothetical protein
MRRLIRFAIDRLRGRKVQATYRRPVSVRDE